MCLLVHVVTEFRAQQTHSSTRLIWKLCVHGIVSKLETFLDRLQIAEVRGGTHVNANRPLLILTPVYIHRVNWVARIFFS